MRQLKSDLQQPKVVKRGQNVNIEVISGSVKIYSTGTATQDGAIGDLIRVRRDNDNTKTTIEATVVGENLVQIILKWNKYEVDIKNISFFDSSGCVFAI